MFAPTHSAPDTGLPTRERPEPDAPVGPEVPAGVPVQVVERTGDWARIVCSNDWSAWVERRLLAPMLLAGAGASAGGTAVVAGNLDRSPIRIGPVPVSAGLVGAALAVASCFLPWVSSMGQGISAFDLPIRFLIDERPTTAAGPKIGWLLVLAAAATVALLFLHAPAMVRRAVGWGLVLVASMFVAQTQRALGSLAAGSVFATLGLGVYAALFGGLLVGLGRKDRP